MKSRSTLFSGLALLSFPFMSLSANYTASRATVDGIEVLRLTDAAHHTEVSIAPSLGNNAYEFKVNGQNIMWSPYKSIAELRTRPAMMGNPFLGPWANRLDQDGFYANGKLYKFNTELKNYRHDGNGFPIHGLVTFAEWSVVTVEADDRRAVATSQLEFWRHPDWMAQFPFAHTVRMTYRLQNGALEVETEVQNLSTDTMPLSVGYHTYYTIPGSKRDEWSVQIPAKEHVKLSPKLIPTTERDPLTQTQIPDLHGKQLDDVYTGLIAGEGGRTEFSLKDGSRKIAVLFGPKYHVAVVYSPSKSSFLCFEPMSGLTNAFNLAQKGEYPELQTIAPGGSWKESFWIQPSGF